MNEDIQPDSRIVELAAYGAATVHEAMGGIGALDPAIRPISPGMKLAAVARTVELPPGDNLMLHIALAGDLRGRILVVDAKGYLAAGPWGEVMTTAARMAGCVGLVIDGAVRDADQIAALGFPVFARGLCIRGTDKRGVGHIGKPIKVGGIVISEGDIVIGDTDGLVAIPSAALPEAVHKARERADKERSLMASIRSGEKTLDLLGLRAIAKSLGVNAS